MHDPANPEAQEAFVYAFIWLIGALASLAGTVNDPRYHVSWRLLGAIGCGGFLATATCGLLSESFGSGVSVGGYPSGTAIGVSSFVGLLGKNSDQVLRWLTEQFASRLPGAPKNEGK